MTLSILQLPPVMASAALDFDITMVIQFGIFALTVAILHVLIIKPYMQAREARSEGTEGSREDADEMHERAEQVLEVRGGRVHLQEAVVRPLRRRMLVLQSTGSACGGRSGLALR